jgi:glutamate racemase
MNERAESAEPDVVATDRIGVFDSGVGGLSVLSALRQRLPTASMMYIGDVAHAPYGARARHEILGRCTLIVDQLAAAGARVIVVACNTATVSAIEALRARWPALVFIGVEPGVKPAAERSRSRRIAVMTTAATATSDRLRDLIARHAQGVHVHVQPCPELASAIERGVLCGPALRKVLQPYCAEIRAADVDTVVLGCTHYSFVKESIRDLLGSEVGLIDTAAAIAERAASLWTQVRPPFGALAGDRVLSTGALHVMQSLVARCAGLTGLKVESLAC